MDEAPTEIVLVGYDNGTVKLLTKSIEKNYRNQSIEKETSKIIKVASQAIGANNRYLADVPKRNAKSFTFNRQEYESAPISQLGSRRNKNEQKFMLCDLCQYKTMKRRLLIQHMMVSHMSKDRACQICGKFLNKWQLKLHMRFHDLKFVCDMCGKRFGDSKALRNHKNSRVCGQKFIEGLKYKNFKCEYCDYRTHTNKLLMVHFRTLHVPKDQICPNCNKLMTVKQLQSHKNYCNHGKFGCQLCEKVFSHPKYLNSHIKTKHVVKQEYEVHVANEILLDDQSNPLKMLEYCEDVSRESIDFDSMIQPTEEHMSDQIIELPLSSNVKMENTSEDEMEMTIEALNEEFINDEVTETDYCSETFVAKLELDQCEEENNFCELDEKKIKIEMDSFTNNNLIQSKNEGMGSYFICDMCGFETFDKQSLIQHFTQVHVEYNIPCPQCDKMLSDKNYYRHLRQHNKKHMCDQCGKRFANLGTLRIHIEKQRCQELTLEEMLKNPAYMSKQFGCTLCLYRGDTEKNLKRHIKYMHREMPKDKICPDCGKQMTVNQYRSHRKSHIKVQCPMCKKWLTDGKFFKTHLENHNRSHQIKSRIFPYPEPDNLTGVYKCVEPNCMYETVIKRFLAQHWQHIHAPKDQKCPFPECHGKTMSVKQLKHHMRGHEKKFKCEVCKTGFPDRRDLKRHVQKKRCKQPQSIVADTSLSENESMEIFTEANELCHTNDESDVVEKESIKIPMDEQIEESIIEKKEISSTLEDTIDKHKSNITFKPNEAGIYECPNCNYETIRKRLLSQHWLHLHGPKIKPCPYPECKGKLMTNLQYKIHTKLHESKLKPEKSSF